MPYEDAKTYRINPFDLTKIWPHSDYPLIKVGTMTLNRNPENFFAQIEQAAFEPSALVPGIGFSPDKMLLGRAFAYSDTHRHRIGPNYLQLPVNRPRVEVNTYTQDGADGLRAPRRRPGLRAELVRSRVRRRGRRGRGRAGRPTARWCVRPTRCARTTTTSPRPARWCARSGTTSIREAFVKTVAGHLLGGVEGDVLERAFQYWSNVDADTGKQIEELVRPGADLGAPGAQPDEAEAEARDPIVETGTTPTSRGPWTRLILGATIGFAAGMRPGPLLFLTITSALRSGGPGGGDRGLCTAAVRHRRGDGHPARARADD